MERGAFILFYFIFYFLFFIYFFFFFFLIYAIKSKCLIRFFETCTDSLYYCKNLPYKNMKKIRQILLQMGPFQLL